MTQNGNILQLSAFPMQNEPGCIEDNSLVPAVFSPRASVSKSVSASHPFNLA